MPVYHVVEEEVRASVEPAVYEEHVGVMADVLDAEGITAAVKEIRDQI